MHKTWIVAVIALVIAVFYVLFNLHYMQQFLDWDQIVYANNIKKAVEYNHTPLFNSHHVHLESGGKLFHEMMRDNYGITDVVFTNRFRALLTAASGLFFLLLFLHDLTGKTLLALAGTLVAAFSLGFLHYATKLDTPIYPAAMTCVILWVLQKIHLSENPVSGLGLALAGGICLAAGIAAHQYMAIPAVIMCACFFLPRVNPASMPDFRPFTIIPAKAVKHVEKPSRRVIQAATLSVVGLALTFMLFFTISSYFRMTYTPLADVPLSEDSRSFQRWFWSYATLDSWGYGFKRFNPKAPFTGFSDAFLAPDHSVYVEHFDFMFSYDMKNLTAPRAFSYNVLAVYTWIVLAGSLLLCVPLYTRFGRLFPAVFLSFFALSAFSTYWEPHYFEFWLVPAILFCVQSVMVACVTAEKLARLTGPRAGRFAFLVPTAALLFFALILFCHNTRDYLVPYSRVKTLRAVSAEWEPSYYNLWSDSIYRHPDNVYQDVYGTKPGEIYPNKN
ncbi:MAG: hypothetical protein EHM28_03990 [Spirochaetaceae bacterium]|nr:MAG: hypothetical protein EHM28_03990 [Spirochaetaceae bacterium]